jgi:Mor family transcriptional regulator
MFPPGLNNRAIVAQQGTGEHNDCGREGDGMKKVKRTIRIEVETETSVFISLSQNRQKSSTWCTWCNATVEIVSVAKRGLSEAALCQQLEAAHVHFENSPDGQVFICLNSAAKTGERNNQIYSQHSGHNVRKEEEQWEKHAH